ncbi:alginate lyase family protein [Dyadobacter psychrotolerans]|uniref:Alginate lyase domain-containing protein n=1 Tax=Dyadobacter psychrotolerans TaxID=2541721 RepID=A0A4R5DUH5_9BACT|nr:alginate lyase family protein [Dyadobacter psychrotolerans]TDE14855.1 hypothetical protein E0F88_16890 [Dyadobacter psychrotolerans]
MRKSPILYLLVILCSPSFGMQTPALQLVYYDYAQLAIIKAGDLPAKPAYKSLLKQADQLLSVPAENVTDGDVPPSGDVHDFFAIGKLAFPNPNTADGMPYVRRDGVTNPEADGSRYDLSRYNTTLSRVNQLCLAFYFTGQEKYAQKASELLRIWFLDPKTKMNPNLKNASALPGVYDGMPIGIIFSVALIKTVDHIKLLSLSKSWTQNDDKELKAWFSDYTTWLLESDMGKKEGLADNNHGSWYTAQIMAFSLYSGNLKRARSLVSLARKQIDQQITAVGSMPRELSRQRSLHYSVYGLQAFVTIARCMDHLGEDLWHYKTSDGRGMHLGFAFLSPYLLGKKQWSWTNIEKGKTPEGALDLFRWAAKKYDDPLFKETSKHLELSAPASSISAFLSSDSTGLK